MTKTVRYVVITPVRNEERHIGLTIESMVKQSIPPAEWIIVNDGSNDRTGEVIDESATQFQWIRIVHRQDRGYRKSGGGVIEAFYDGYSKIGQKEWDFVVKLDGDLSFDTDYFEKCFSRFADAPGLGIGGGTICLLKEGGLEVEYKGDPPFHVRGATKIYRRACWEQISPLLKAPGWDTIDEVKANMHGWKTQTFNNLKLIQHKGTGSADGIWRTWFKNGRANYIAGYHPLFMFFKCIKRVFQKPYIISAIGLFYGYVSGYWERVPQINDRPLIDYLRKQQLGLLFFKRSIWK
jgi:glycosyltransferase involved in cell wall biosynthesis